MSKFILFVFGVNFGHLILSAIYFLTDNIPTSQWYGILPLMVAILNTIAATIYIYRR
jgi:hypothetical protein